MNKNELTARVRAALEDWEYPCEEIESQPGLQWFQPLSDDYENDYALGELFFASDLTDEDMNGLEIVQCNLVFQRELPAGAADALRALGFTVSPSLTNFLFVTHPVRKAPEIFEYLRQKNIFIRYFRLPRIDNYLRITVGTDAQMDALIAALREMP